MGHAGTVTVPRGAQGARKTTPDAEMGAEDREAQAPAPACWAPETGASWPQALDTVRDQASENGPGRGKDLGLAKKGDGSWAWNGTKVGRWGEEGSPAPACPLSQARTLPGSPGAAAALAARPRIACLPGRAARASGASARNRARPGGPRAAGVRGRPGLGTRQGAGTW